MGLGRKGIDRLRFPESDSMGAMEYPISSTRYLAIDKSVRKGVHEVRIIMIMGYLPR